MLFYKVDPVRAINILLTQKAGRVKCNSKFKVMKHVCSRVGDLTFLFTL